MTHADLSGLTEQGHPWNEIVVDGRGNAYLSNQGFDFPGGQATQWRGTGRVTGKSRTGRLMTAQAPAPGAGWP